MASGLGYQVRGVKTSYWPVGYPAFLAILAKFSGSSLTIAKLANVILSCLNVALSSLLAYRWSQSKLALWVCGILMSIHPSIWAYSQILASEPIFTFILLTILHLILCNKSWIFRATLIGILAGILAHIRPQGILYPFFLIPIIWPKEDNRNLFKVMSIVLVVACCVLTPWTIRNYNTWGRFVFVSTNGGDNLLIGNSPRSQGRYLNPDSLGFDFVGLNEAQRDRAATSFAMRHIRDHFDQVPRLAPAKLSATFLSGTDAPYWLFQTVKGQLTVPGRGNDKLLYKSFRSYSEFATRFLFWIGFGTAICLLIKKNFQKTQIVALMSIVAYTAILSVIFFGNGRFAYPSIPALLISVGLWVGSIEKSIVGSRNS